MEVCEGLGASLVVPDGPPEPCGPCKGALDHPSSGQQDKAALGLWQLDDLESDPVFGRRCCGLLAGVTLIDEGDCEAFPGPCLNGLGDPADFGAIVGVGRGTWRARRCPSVSTAGCGFEPFLRLAPS